MFQKIRRWWFFSIEKLQITRRERISVTVLIVLITLLQGVKIGLSRWPVTAPSSYDKILEEFQMRSHAVPTEMSKAEESEQEMTSNKPVQEQEATQKPKEALKVNINEANMADLMKLPGIGSTYARRIVEYRERMGGFRSVDELTKVKGIGPKTLEKLRPHITL
jgi:comEA protein